MSRVLLGFVLYLCLFSPLLAQSVPVVTDSRIKTFVYNENDVFTVMTHYGYQSNIEFSKTETVMTVSVGDRVAWQIVPAGRRLFIKAMEENAHTNMTVVTNKRAYQFDLRASGQQPLHPNEELVYVVRFFYPEDLKMQPNPAIYSDSSPAAAYAPQAMPATTQQAAPVAAVDSSAVYASPAVAAAPAGGVNYNYTFSGPAEAAPVKIYDDGQATYFTFAPMSASDVPPQFFILSADGLEQPIQPSYTPQGDAVIPMLAPRFSIRRGDANIMVFNENFPSQQAM